MHVETTNPITPLSATVRLRTRVTGRTGRALVHAHLRAKGRAKRLPRTSSVFGEWKWP